MITAVAVSAVAVGVFSVGSRVLLLVNPPRIAPTAYNLRPAAPGPRGAMGSKAQPSDYHVASATRGTQRSAPGEAGVARGEISAFAEKLSKAAPLTSVEETRLVTFLEFIARSQSKVDRVIDEKRRGDLQRRLDYQTIYGIKIRVAPEKREALAQVLNQGVPRLTARTPSNAAP